MLFFDKYFIALKWRIITETSGSFSIWVYTFGKRIGKKGIGERPIYTYQLGWGIKIPLLIIFKNY